MQVSDPTNNLLRKQVLARDGAGARQTAKQMGPAAGEVLLELAGHNQTSVRQLVLELAAENPSVGSSRAILSRLSDGSATIRSIAGSIIGQCKQKEIVEDLSRDRRLGLRLNQLLVQTEGDCGRSFSHFLSFCRKDSVPLVLSLTSTS